ncbi:hypothetical protein U1Q18_020921, partial [Sarracenia purpurea var. burkii]
AAGLLGTPWLLVACLGAALGLEWASLRHIFGLLGRSSWHSFALPWASSLARLGSSKGHIGARH